VIFNPRSEATDVTLPEGKWNIYIDADNAGTKVLGTAEGTVSVAPISAMVLVQEPETAGSIPVLPVALALAAAGAAALVLLLKKRKK